jgi:hypothetical protein
MLFRTEEEEDHPTQLERPRSPHSLGHRRFSNPLMFTGGTEEEEDDEDTPGMFKRVIIRVAKLPRHIQSTTISSLDASQGIDSMWGISLSELNMPLHFMADWDPLQPFPLDGDYIPFHHGEVTFNWGQENSNIENPPTVPPTPPWDDFLSMNEGNPSVEKTPPPQSLVEVREDTTSPRPYDMLNNLDAPDDMFSFQIDPAASMRCSSNKIINCNTIWYVSTPSQHILIHFFG